MNTDNFLLKEPLAIRLYTECARDLPLIDYHNHLPVREIISDKAAENITTLWISADPYKHRAMRILGVPERCITGDASDFEKFEKWYACLPKLAGNPLYDWSILEFRTLFGMELAPFRREAKEVWDEVSERCRGLSAAGILRRFRIEYAAPCAGILDDLQIFERLEQYSPSLRADDVTAVSEGFVRALEKKTGVNISGLSALEQALQLRLTDFRAHGCRFADHALDCGFRYVPEDGQNEARFARLLAGEALSAADADALRSGMLRIMGRLYAENGMVMQLHIGAQRTTSTRLRTLAGAAGGYAAIGSGVDVRSLTGLLDDIERSGRLPKTILFTLNPADNAVMATLSGSYSADNVQALVCQGPAWWWCDHEQGIREMLEHLRVFSLLSVFPGMTTDSRSPLSFIRHDYFRRVLCQWIAEKVRQDVLPDDFALLSELVRRMCYQNAKDMIS